MTAVAAALLAAALLVTPAPPRQRIGLTAPPIGLNVFVMKSVAGATPITRIYRGVLPFIASDLVRLAILVLFPGLSLALVRLLT